MSAPSNPHDPHPEHGHMPHHFAEAAPLHDPVDEWHDHSHDAQPQHAHGDVQDSRLVLAVGIALAAVILGSVLAVFGFYTHYNTQRMAEREHTTAKELPKLAPSPTDETRKLKSDALLVLERGGPVQMPTEKEGVMKTITISPIDKAMDEVARGYASTSTHKTAQGN